jgi:hypothetical protein
MPGKLPFVLKHYRHNTVLPVHVAEFWGWLDCDLEKVVTVRFGHHQVFLDVATIPYVKPGTSSTELKLWD